MHRLLQNQGEKTALTLKRKDN